MPCDGIAVASLDFAIANELLANPEAIVAVVKLLNALNHSAELIGENSMMVDGYAITLSSGILSGRNVPQKTLDAAKDACNSIAGALTQEKVVQQVEQSVQVLSRTTTPNGYVVMKVIL